MIIQIGVWCGCGLFMSVTIQNNVGLGIEQINDFHLYIIREYDFNHGVNHY